MQIKMSSSHLDSAYATQKTRSIDIIVDVIDGYYLNFSVHTELQGKKIEGGNIKLLKFKSFFVNL